MVGEDVAEIEGLDGGGRGLQLLHTQALTLNRILNIVRVIYIYIYIYQCLLRKTFAIVPCLDYECRYLKYDHNRVCDA